MKSSDASIRKTIMKQKRRVKRFTVKGKTVVFRHPCWGDIDGLMRHTNGLYKNSLKEPLWLPTRECSKLDIMDSLSTMLKREELGNSFQLVVEVDGRISGQGFIDLRKGQFGEGYASLGLNLAKSARRMGIGTRLMGTLVREAKRRKLHGILLDVAAANPAMKLYEKCGFKEVGRRPHYIKSNFGKEPFEKRPDLLTMVKMLD